MQNRDPHANNASFGPKDVPLLRLPVNSQNNGFGNAYSGPMAGYQHQQPPSYFVASSAAPHLPMHYPHPNHVQYHTSPNPPSSDAMRMSSWVSSDSSRLSSFSPHASPRGSSRSAADHREVDEHNTDGQEDEMSPRSPPPSAYPNSQNFSPQSTSSPILEEIPSFRLGVSSAPSSLRSHPTHHRTDVNPSHHQILQERSSKTLTTNFKLPVPKFHHFMSSGSIIYPSIGRK